MSEVSNPVPAPDAQPKVERPAVVVRPKPVWHVDTRDKVALPLTLLIALLTVQVLLYSRPMPGFGTVVLVVAFYALRWWHSGKAAFATRASRLLLLATALLTLTFAFFSNFSLRLLNHFLLFCLIAVQLFEGAPGAGAWWEPSMLLRRAGLFLEGLFGRVASVGAVLASLGKGAKQKRLLAALGGGAVGIALLCIVLPLLRSADAVFASVTSQAVQWLQENLGSAFFRMVLALILTPFLFSLLDQLRYPKETAPSNAKATEHAGLDPAMPLVLLLLLDVTYVFFLGTQLAALFGGEAYVAEVGVSYAEYARSGFFQLVWVALLNLTAVLSCVQFSRREGALWKGVRALSVVLIALTAVLLVSACARMTLYVTVYGLSLKRLFTYWAMAFLAVCLVCALRKVFVPSFGFFRICFASGIAVWLLFNYVGPDAIVARHNVNAYQSGQIRWIDTSYLGTLSYDTLDLLENIPECNYLVTQQRQQAVDEASSWQTWSLSAWRAAK